VDQPVDISQLTKSPSRAALRVSLRLSAGPEKFACSGLLWKRGDDLYLITNWHCVTGWHPIKKQPLSAQGFWAEIAVLPIIIRNNAGETVWREVTLRLRTDQDTLWFQHPSFGQRVDVAAIKLPGLTSVELLSLPISEVPQDNLKFMVADDAFVLGFPDVHTGGFPIWKRASLATEPYIDHDNLPKVLVDTATRKGMSGAPVFVIQRGVHRTEHPEMFTMGHGQRFLGVYSSRVGDELEGFQLGEVWKAAVIDEIINGGVKGQDPRLP
jgi:hypothetical protein